MGSSQKNQAARRINYDDAKKRTLFQKRGYDCGCLGLPVNEGQGKQPTQLPLKKIVYDIALLNGVAEVALHQTYVNRGDKFLELQYRFPVHPNACIHKFVATFSKMRMEGVVKEKDMARVMYSEAVRAGKRAALGEVDEQSKDILTLQLGNLCPGEEVTVEIHYVEELSIVLNTFYQFTFVPRLTPRYVNSIPKSDILSAFRQSVKTVNGQFEWDFRLSLRTPRKITSFKSPTHVLLTEKQNDMGTEYAFTLEKGEMMNKAFNFLFSTQDFALPSYTLGRTDAGSSVMVSFIPKFCTLDLKDAELAAVNAQSFETDMDAVRGQYIFLLDRSGSMSGKPIEKAKQALILFLKSLPIDTYFQIVSFGDSYSYMFWSSQKNSNESIKNAIQKIAPISADMGGTQIQAPLKKILTSQNIKGYPKQVFLLTDGGVSNTDTVIELAGSHTKYTRVHTIGLGSGVSQALILGCAQKGRGGHVFIGDYEDPSSKIIQLLNESLTPVISEVSLAYDKSVVESIVPNPAKLPFILKGDVANFYLTFNGQLSQPTTISFSYKDSLNGLPFKTTIQISPQMPSEAYVDKMANFRRIRALEHSERMNGNVEDYIYFANKIDQRQEILSLSTKHQILSKYTAFVCVETELVDGRHQEIKAKGAEKVQIVNVDQPIVSPLLQSFQECDENQICSAPPHNGGFPGAPPRSLGGYGQIPKSKSRALDISDQQCQEKAQKYCGLPIMMECAQQPQMSRCSADIQRECLMDLAPICANVLGEQIEYEQEYEQKIESVSYKKMAKQKAFNIKEERAENLVQKPAYPIKDVVKEQQFEGFWNKIDIIKHLYGEAAVKEVNKQSSEDRTAAITFLIASWMEKHYPEKEYSLIIRKAKNWLKKQKRASEFPTLFAAYIK